MVATSNAPVDTSAARGRPRRDAALALGAGILTVGAVFVAVPLAAALAVVTLVLAVRCVTERNSTRGRVVAAVAVGAAFVVALPIAMLVVSQLPAERAYQDCAEQPDVTQCHDPLTSWLP